MKSNLHLYSIMRLDLVHLDEICEDIRFQYENGITRCPLFSMTLVPEDNPPVNKAKIMCEQYKQFKEKLDSLGIPSGVLVQASIGHGWTLSKMFPFQQYVGIRDGVKTNTVCPFDDGFCDYIYEALRTITSYNPDHIMIDDDLRLMYRGGGGCACELHLKRFNELAETSLTREELLEILDEQGELGHKYSEIFVQTQKEAVIKTAKTMRAGIDSVNPKMEASYCCVGNNAEFAVELAEILAGEGNPIMIRINNGNYTSQGPRYLSNGFFRAASQIAKLKSTADIILAETDTCPQNRYSTGAMMLHAHFTGTLLEGAQGAKQWITRLGSFEPQSGVAYRKILSKYSGFYNELAKIVPELTWRGCRIPLRDKPNFYAARNTVDEDPNGWALCVLERLGIPMYFSAENGGVLCLEGEKDLLLTDSQILEALKGNVFLASDTAKRLISRGFGEYIGVDVRDWQGKQPSGEELFVNSNNTKIQVGIKELVLLDEKSKPDSMVFHSADNIIFEELFAGSVIYENKLGGKVFTFCGTPKAEYNLVEAFSFLNYSRKQQLIKMLEQTDELPLYYPDDEEVYLKAAQVSDGSLFCAVFNIGTDPIENLKLVIFQKAEKIEQLMPDGTRKEIEFEVFGNEYVLNTPCNTLDPVILFIK